MNKIELSIIAISRSVTQSSNYAVVLREDHGERRLPVIVGGNEAQSIAIAIERLDSSRPMTHDLFKNTLEILNSDLREVVINEIREGIFFSRLILDRDGDIIEIDSRTSDALALAVRFGCPIYTYDHIMSEAGVTMEDEETEEEMDDVGTQTAARDKDNLARYNVKELNTMLDEVLSNENYEKAALIRDELQRRGSN
ncbi:bifunctional nuclease family protein [Lewinella sp. 4G2]|uniref:bifunctional nuclease family protein n=1 Tax=Lewinella sp. 4G2 TaxID=1803372 RepID=UPI0007B4A201|nr:bifunctional nuclease family protein [Lewinella sp. 4G2]OAV44980.1 hypothetical protein A3850_010960 [Lewinella sp. 4G2]